MCVCVCVCVYDFCGEKLTCMDVYMFFIGRSCLYRNLFI